MTPTEPYFVGKAELICDQKNVLSVSCDLYLERLIPKRMPEAIGYGRAEIKGTIIAESPSALLPYVSSNAKPDDLDMKLSDGRLLHVSWLDSDGAVSCFPKNL